MSRTMSTKIHLNRMGKLLDFHSLIRSWGRGIVCVQKLSICRLEFANIARSDRGMEDREPAVSGGTEGLGFRRDGRV
jgi:hypothetical protein